MARADLLGPPGQRNPALSRWRVRSVGDPSICAVRQVEDERPVFARSGQHFPVGFLTLEAAGRPNRRERAAGGERRDADKGDRPGGGRRSARNSLIARETFRSRNLGAQPMRAVTEFDRRPGRVPGRFPAPILALPTSVSTKPRVLPGREEHRIATVAELEHEHRRSSPIGNARERGHPAAFGFSRPAVGGLARDAPDEKQSG